MPFFLLVLAAVLAVPCAGQSSPLPQERASIVFTRPAPWTATPLDRARVQTGQSIAVEGRVVAGAPIVAVELDGARAALRRQGDGTAWFSGFVSPPPRPGDVEVELRVLTEDGNQQVLWLPVTVEAAGPRQADRWVRELLRYPERNRYAVVVGVNDHPDRTVAGVRFAEADARAFAAFLRSPAAGGGGIPAAQVHLLTGREATARNIRSALSDVLHRVTDRDIIYLFLAGHVGPEPDRVTPLYFYSRGAELDQLPGTALEMNHVQDVLRRAGAHQVVVLADADRAGMIQQQNRRGVYANIITDAFTRSLDVEAGGLFVLTASAGTEPSREGAEWGGGHGVFTHVLLEGLGGAADEDGDGMVTLDELQRHVRRRVQEATAGGQIPSVAATSYDRYWPAAIVR